MAFMRREHGSHHSSASHSQEIEEVRCRCQMYVDLDHLRNDRQGKLRIYVDLDLASTLLLI